MIKAFAVSLLIALAGSSVSEFSLALNESFTLHFEHDYVFTLSACGSSCISLRVTQMIGETPSWTGQLFELQQGKSYPLQMEFKDVIFDSLYVVSAGDVITLRVNYRDPTPAVSNQRVVKATSEKETVETVSFVIIGELSAVIFLVFFAAHRLLNRNPAAQRLPDSHDSGEIPGPVMGFHDSWQAGIPRSTDEDPDLELLEHIRELERLKEMETRRRMRRRMEEDQTMGLDWI